MKLNWRQISVPIPPEPGGSKEPRLATSPPTSVSLALRTGGGTEQFLRILLWQGLANYSQQAESYFYK